MMDTFRAYRINNENGNIVAGFETLSVDDLTAGNVAAVTVYLNAIFDDTISFEYFGWWSNYDHLNQEYTEGKCKWSELPFVQESMTKIVQQ